MYSDWFLRCENEPNHSLEDLCLKKKKNLQYEENHMEKKSQYLRFLEELKQL